MEADRFRNNKVRCAVIDTNVLLYMFLNKADVISQLRDYGVGRFLITESVLKELQKLEVNLKGREKRAAKLARELVKDFEIVKIVKTESEGDNSIIEAAETHGCIIITNDKMLRKRARERKIPVGFLKEEGRVFFEDF